MSSIPRISDAEWDVVNLIWEDHPVSAQTVAAALVPKNGWSHRTVTTLLARLVKKNILGFRSEGKRYLYHPLLSRGECLSAVSRSFLERVGGNSPSPLLAQFVRQSKLTASQIRELREILDEKEGRS